MKYQTVLDNQSIKVKVGISSSFGTFGELLQGVLSENDMDFLVTLPVSCYSKATFEPDIESSTLRVIPEYKRKSLMLAQRILQNFTYKIGGTITLESDLPEGKGMASSSADLVATARAVGDGLGINISANIIESLLREIEPSDGVMHPGIVSFYHKQVQLQQHLGSLPPLTIVGIDEGGEIDTIEFNRIPKHFSNAEKIEYSYLLKKLSTAIKNKDLKVVGEVTTRSALMNQKLRPKHHLNTLIKICKEINGLGVVVAHSGTKLGILLSQQDNTYTEQLQHAFQACEKYIGDVSIYYSLSFSER